MSNFVLHLNENQAKVVREALEFHARIGTAQLSEIVNLFRHDPRCRNLNFEAIEPLIKELKMLLFNLHTNAGYGIGNPEVPDKYNMTYDLYQVVRHALAWDRNPKGDILVDFDEPRKTSQEPLAKMEKV